MFRDILPSHQVLQHLKMKMIEGRLEQDGISNSQGYPKVEVIAVYLNRSAKRMTLLIFLIHVSTPCSC